MFTLKRWQWLILALPPSLLVAGLFIIAGLQLQQWGLSWIWGVVAIALIGWRWLLSRWTQPNQAALAQNLTEVQSQLQTTLASSPRSVDPQKVEDLLREVLATARNDAPIWEDWATFADRCQTLVRAIANLYHPEVKYPLLNIYVPQAYGLIRGTVDDLDRYMRVATPTLNQVSVGQVYQAYETYRALETPLRRVGTVLNLSRWLWNPIAAVAKEVGRPLGEQANQQLLINFSQTLRETVLTILGKQAIALYGGQTALTLEQSASSTVQAQTLRDLIEAADSPQTLASEPTHLLLIGRTGAGKSSLINTLFQEERVAVDVLPSTDQITSYRWDTAGQESLVLWDSPGYEQVNRADFRQQVLQQAIKADMLLLVSSALDPALEADIAFLTDFAKEGVDIPIFLVLTQVDRLRPVREWQPPYDWPQGDRPKERNIRAAVKYRQGQMGQRVQQVLPLVTAAAAAGRLGWGDDELALELVEAIAPVKSQKLAQFLRSRDARITAATRLIERYAVQMASSQGLVALIKTPLLASLAARLTGTPELGNVLAQAIPAEQVPIVASKVMLTYELANLLQTADDRLPPSELLKLWPALWQNSDRSPAQNAWAWGQVLVEYWTQDLSPNALQDRFAYYLALEQQAPSSQDKQNANTEFCDRRP